jgi:hypothetical protein
MVSGNKGVHYDKLKDVKQEIVVYVALFPESRLLFGGSMKGTRSLFSGQNKRAYGACRVCPGSHQRVQITPF